MPLPRPSFQPFTRRRTPEHLAPELGHLAEFRRAVLYCTPDLRWQPQEAANALEPEVLAERVWQFQIDHWAIEDEAVALFASVGVELAGVCYLRVLHSAVDLPSRVCQRCGTVVWDPNNRERLTEASTLRSG